MERCAIQTKKNNNLTQKERERTLVGLTNELKELALKDNLKYAKIVTSLQNFINSLNDECDESTMTSNATKFAFVANPATNTTGSQSRNQGSVPGAPGTKSNKRYGKQSANKRKSQISSCQVCSRFC